MAGASRGLAGPLGAGQAGGSFSRARPPRRPSFPEIAWTRGPRALRAENRAISREVPIETRESCATGCGRAGAAGAPGGHSCGEPWARGGLNSVEATHKAFFEPRGIRGIRGRSQLAGQEAEFLRAETIPLALQRRQFGSLEGDFLARGFASHHAAACESLADEPVIDGQGALDHVGSAGA